MYEWKDVGISPEFEKEVIAALLMNCREVVRVVWGWREGEGEWRKEREGKCGELPVLHCLCDSHLLESIHDDE